jgi:hypothetical protein
VKRLAIFVEGQVELIFVTKLLEEIAGEKNIAIQQEVLGRETKQSISILQSPSIQTGTRYYILIRDCGGESRVMSEIRDNYDGLQSAGYDGILGLMDVYPKAYSDIPRLKEGMSLVSPKGSLPAQVVLAVMEIEAWFIAETSHFPKVHPELTLNLIEEQLGITIVPEEIERWDHPSERINQIYHLVPDRSYRKKRGRVNRTIDILDYASLYLNLRYRIEHLGEFIDHIDQFLTV